MLRKFLRFEQIVYPLWRRKVHPLLKPLSDSFFSRRYPVYADRQPPQTARHMARFLHDWDILPAADLQSLVHALETTTVRIEHVEPTQRPQRHDGSPLRIPAQWAHSERILMSWGRMYPALWPMHAQMVEAISEVALAEVLLPSELWARAVAVYLEERGKAVTDNVQFLVLRTDDVWIRDYGPLIGVDEQGSRVAVDATYAVLPQYPQADDNGMTARWAAHHGIAVQALDLHTEGGNLWSDGQGTLLMSSQIFYSNRYHNRDSLLAYLHRIFDFQKAIITPRLTLEITGHIDLLAKLVNAQTVFVGQASSGSTEEVLRKTKRLFERETNAAGERYQVIELPTPPLYLNWFTHQIRRAYTNALTINGRVLVPQFSIAQDDLALRIYEQHMPGYDIIPIDSTMGINGGGSVHCMTKEVPLVG